MKTNKTDEKWHIRDDGTVDKCNAKKGKCPFQSHFPTREEAELAADEMNQEIYRSQLIKEISEIDTYFAELNELPIEYLEEYLNEIKTYQPSDPLEIPENFCKLSLSDLAELTRVQIGPGRVTEFEMCKKEIMEWQDVLPSKVYIPDTMNIEKREEIRSILKQAMPDSKYDFPAYLVWEDECYIKAWTSDPKYFDIITISKKDMRVTFNEIKDLSTSAQVSNLSLEQDENGTIIVNNDDVFGSEKILNFLKEYDPIKDRYINKKVNLTEDESLEYFIKLHTSKNCTKLSFKQVDGKMKTVFLTNHKGDPIEKDIEKLKSAGIRVDLLIRQNNREHTKKATKRDVDRFSRTYNEFFKNGKAKEKFTLSELDMRKVKAQLTPPKGYEHLYKDVKTKPYVRIGEFIAVFDELDMNTELDISNFKKMTPALTGKITQKIV